MKCPRCRTQYAFFEKTCTRCGIDLIDEASPEGQIAPDEVRGDDRARDLLADLERGASGALP